MPPGRQKGSGVTNIAMWSGPRNISTAMMYSFGNRPDCVVWDEPFYAFSLLNYGNDHPGREATIAGNETNFERIVRRCQAPAGKSVFYQKHMTHHMLPGYDRQWILDLTNAFLIRAPELVLASYTRKWSEVDLRAIGLVEQAEIFDMTAQKLGAAPPVIDAEDVLASPKSVLTALCMACGISFDEAMLAWPPGPKPFDGNWGPYWYNAAWSSIGFSRSQEDVPVQLPPRLAGIADQARPFYEKLRAFRLT